MNKDTEGEVFPAFLVKGEKEAPCGRSRGLKEDSRRGYSGAKGGGQTIQGLVTQGKELGL